MGHEIVGGELFADAGIQAAFVRGELGFLRQVGAHDLSNLVLRGMVGHERASGAGLAIDQRHDALVLERGRKRL